MGQPLYEGIAAEIREHILRGKLSPGQRLPSEADLVDQYGAARQTVRHALTVLSREHLIISGQGRGWFVRDTNPLVWNAWKPERNTRTDIQPNDVWAQDVRDQGREPSERIEVAILIPELRIAERLGLGDGEHAVARRRIRYVDGDVSTTADTYYPLEIVKDTPIARPGDVLPGVYAVLEQLGHGWHTYRDEIIARAATVQESERFGVAVGDPMSEVVRTRYDGDKRPVAVTLTVVPGDRVIITYEGSSQ